MKIFKRGENFYSVVDHTGKEVAVFNYYKSAMRYIKNAKKGAK